jgi:hypothetical protein
MAKAPAAPAPKAWTLKTLIVGDCGDKVWTTQTYDTKAEANAALASMNPDQSSVYPTDKQSMLDKIGSSTKGGN